MKALERERQDRPRRDRKPSGLASLLGGLVQRIQALGKDVLTTFEPASTIDISELLARLGRTQRSEAEF